LFDLILNLVSNFVGPLAFRLNDKMVVMHAHKINCSLSSRARQGK
jgi:hypothetical protein